jgi:hypothetical protein
MSAERFKIKCASFASIFPSVAGPAVGGYAGYAIGNRYHSPHLGALLGTITGGTAGKLLSEDIQESEKDLMGIPPGAPYTLDPTAEDIPAWALQGAQLLQPQMQMQTRTAGHLSDVLGGDILGAAWPVVEGVRQQQPAGQIAKNVAGQTLGTLGGGFAGHALGGLLDKAVGHQVMGPLSIPLSTLLAGLGATIGNVKGRDFARK